MTSVIIDRNAGLSSAAAIKGPCLAGTIANITLSGEQTVDGIAVVTGDRVLVKNQTNAAQNGLYLVDTGDWSRCKDFSRNDDVVKGTRVVVTDGTQANFYQITFSGAMDFGTTEIGISLTPEQLVIAYLTPEIYGAKGDGVTIDDDALTRWITACNASGLHAHGRPDAIYRCSSTLTLTVRVPFSGNGCEFTVPNDGQARKLFIFESAEDDYETVDIATVNAWTGLERGSNIIPQLTEAEWAYTIISTDQVLLARSAPGALTNGESFAVTDAFGYLDRPLVRTYSQPFSDMTCTRRKMRGFMTIDGLRIRVSVGASASMNGVVQTLRPRSRFVGCSIVNESGANIQQGFITTNATDVSYQDCSVYGMKEVTTEYGFLGGYANGTVYTNCSTKDCRRGVDENGSKYIRVEGGSYPNGVGGHWVDYFDIFRAVLGHRDFTNGQCIHVSGSNVKAADCHFHLGKGPVATSYKTKAINMRSDLPELTGYCILRGGTITIYDDPDTVIGNGPIQIVKLDLYDFYDCLRTVGTPDYIEVTPDIIKQIGASSTNDIYLVAMGNPSTAIHFPQSVNIGGSMLIRPGRVELDAGEMNGSTPRLVIGLFKGETQTGSSMSVKVQNISAPYVFCSPFNASSGGAGGRYDILVEDATSANAHYELRFGSCKTARLRRCAQVASTQFNRAGSVSALGDEAIDYEDFGSQHQGLCINPFGGVIQRGNGITVADGAYGPDGWIGLNETGNTTFAVAANVADNLPFQMRWSQPDVSSKKLGAVCFIGSTESVALRSRLVTLVANLRSTASMTARYAILEWTGTANAPTRDVVNNWSSGSFTAGGFFISTTTNVLAVGSVALTAITNTITDPLYAHVGSSCNNLAIVFWTDSALATNGYLQLAADLYPGFERPLTRRRSVTDELSRCGAFYQSKAMRTINGKMFVHATPVMVKTPAAAATVGTASPNVTNHGVLLTHTVDDVASTVTLAGDI